MPSSPLRPGPVTILQGRIVAVDPARWLCTVRCSALQREFRDVLIPSLYSSSEGDGVHYMPEVGAVVFVATPSDGGNSFLLLSAPQTSPATVDGQPGSYHSGRPYLSPGDLVVLTRDGNGVIARRGGLTEIRSTALSRIAFDPTTDQVATLAQRWSVETPCGRMSWEPGPGSDTEIDTTALLTFEGKEFISSPSWSTRTRVGHIGERLWFDAPPAEIPLVDTVAMLPVSSIGGAIELIPITVRAPAVLDPAAVVYAVEINSAEDREGADLSLRVLMSRAGDAQLETRGKLRLLKEGQNQAEPTVLGRSLLEGLQASLTEIQTALVGLGATLPETASFLADIATSLETQRPFLSSALETD